MTKIEEFKSFGIGRLEPGKKELTAEDVAEFKQSKGLGRLFTQIKIAVQGKGWLNEESAKALFQNKDWSSLETIHSFCQQTLSEIRARDQELAYRKPGKLEVHGDDFTTTVTITKREIKHEKKELKKYQSEAEAVQGMVSQVVKMREGQVRSELRPLEALKEWGLRLKEHPHLGPVFEEYLKTLGKTPENKPIHEDNGKIRAASQSYAISTTRPREFEAAKVYHQAVLFEGFMEYLTEGFVERKLSQENIRGIHLALAAQTLDLPAAIGEEKGVERMENAIARLASWENAEGKFIENPDIETKRKDTDAKLASLQNQFPGKEFAPLLDMVRRIAEANAEDAKEPHLADALNRFFEKLSSCDSGAKLVKLVQNTYETVQESRTQTLGEIHQDSELGPKFKRFIDEFGKHLFSPKEEGKEEYFGRYPSLNNDFLNRGPSFAAERLMGYFERNREGAYVLSEEGWNSPHFKTLFAEYLTNTRERRLII